MGDKEIKKIQFAESNTFGALNPLVSFNCLVDTDFGLLVLIAQKFFDTSVFNKEFFDANVDIDDMKRTVYFRKEKNPLSLCIKDREIMDDFYNQFFEQYYPDILKRSMITDFTYALNSLKSSGAVFSILCRNKYELEYANNIKALEKHNKIMIDSGDALNHNQFFFKGFDDIDAKFFHPDFIDKHIYIARYNFTDIDNLSEDDFKIYALIDNMRNVITKFDLYTNMKGNNQNGI